MRGRFFAGTGLSPIERAGRLSGPSRTPWKTFSPLVKRITRSSVPSRFLTIAGTLGGDFNCRAMSHPHDANFRWSPALVGNRLSCGRARWRKAALILRELFHVLLKNL